MDRILVPQTMSEAQSCKSCTTTQKSTETYPTEEKTMAGYVLSMENNAKTTSIISSTILFAYKAAIQLEELATGPQNRMGPDSQTKLKTDIEYSSQPNKKQKTQQ